MTILAYIIFAALIFLAVTAGLIWLIPIAFPAFGAVSFTQGMAMAGLLLLLAAATK
jgi:hypothetical protein